MKIHASGEDGFLHPTDIGQEVAKKSMNTINSLQSSSLLPVLTVKRRKRTLAGWSMSSARSPSSIRKMLTKQKNNKLPA